MADVVPTAAIKESHTGCEMFSEFSRLPSTQVHHRWIYSTNTADERYVMSNPVTQQQQGYPTLAAPTAIGADNVAAAQQQMSFLMNSGLMSNPLFQPFLMAQQQSQPGEGNSNIAQQQQQAVAVAVAQQAMANAMKSGGGYDMSQMMNYNQAILPTHTPSAVVAAPTGVSLQPAFGAPATTTNGGTKRNSATVTDDSGNTKASRSDRAKLNRDRNREHARSTRERKKAYVQKLRELVEKLHAERNEEARKRRVAVQHLAEIHRVRCDVVHTFLSYHSKCEQDERRWFTILEDDFWLKQPVTPYRSFHRTEIDKVCDLCI
jgi:hypothetical protein